MKGRRRKLNPDFDTRVLSIFDIPRGMKITMRGYPGLRVVIRRSNYKKLIESIEIQHPDDIDIFRSKMVYVIGVKFYDCEEKGTAKIGIGKIRGFPRTDKKLIYRAGVRLADISKREMAIRAPKSAVKSQRKIVDEYEQRHIKREQKMAPRFMALLSEFEPTINEYGLASALTKAELLELKEIADYIQFIRLTTKGISVSDYDYAGQLITKIRMVIDEQQRRGNETARR